MKSGGGGNAGTPGLLQGRVVGNDPLHSHVDPRVAKGRQKHHQGHHGSSHAET